MREALLAHRAELEGRIEQLRLVIAGLDVALAALGRSGDPSSGDPIRQAAPGFVNYRPKRSEPLHEMIERIRRSSPGEAIDRPAGTSPAEVARPLPPCELVLTAAGGTTAVPEPLPLKVGPLPEPEKPPARRRGPYRRREPAPPPEASPAPAAGQETPAPANPRPLRPRATADTLPENLARLMRTLADLPGARLRVIGERAGIAHGTMGWALGVLETRGWIERNRVTGAITLLKEPPEAALPARSAPTAAPDLDEPLPQPVQRRCGCGQVFMSRSSSDERCASCRADSERGSLRAEVS